MNNETSTIDQVRGLVASIPKHTGMYASVAEGFEIRPALSLIIASIATCIT